MKAPTATWGGMINQGRNFLQDEPQLSLIPAAFMFVTVLALNFVGDRIRSRFDVKDVQGEQASPRHASTTPCSRSTTS